MFIHESQLELQHIWLQGRFAAAGSAATQEQQRSTSSPHHLQPLLPLCSACTERREQLCFFRWRCFLLFWLSFKTTHCRNFMEKRIKLDKQEGGQRPHGDKRSNRESAVSPKEHAQRRWKPRLKLCFKLSFCLTKFALYYCSGVAGASRQLLRIGSDIWSYTEEMQPTYLFIGAVSVTPLYAFDDRQDIKMHKIRFIEY